MNEGKGKRFAGVVGFFRYEKVVVIQAPLKTRPFIDWLLICPNFCFRQESICF